MASTYNTKQKQLILDILLKSKEKQLSCEEIEETLRKNGTPVGKSTVYRYLLSLQSEGKVRKFNSETSKSATFSYIENEKECSRHLHLRCLSCGEFTHLSCKLMDEVSQHLINDHKFSIDNSKTVLYGLCEKCSASKGEYRGTDKF